MKSLYLFITFISAIFASVIYDQPAVSKKCTRKLEEILFKPDPCAFRYLQTVANKFRARAQILFGPQDLVDSFIFSFENEYKVKVDLVNPFGGVVKYHPDGTKSIGEPAQYSNTAQAYLNFPGFVRQVNQENFYYTFQVYSPDGQYYAVTLIMPLSDDPIVC